MQHSGNHDHSEGGPIVGVEDLVAGYGDKVVLDKVSFQVAPGEILIILGGSGCGKSTLIKHLIGLQEPLAGRVLIDGDDIVGAGTKLRNRILTKIGVAFQSGALFGSMTVLENIRLPMEEFTALPEEAMSLMARMKLSMVGLEESESKLPSDLSGGMKKRAALARALALDPKIVFLDEPSAGLDPVTSAELDELILTLRETLGLTFVVVTHELESVYTIADRVLLLDKSVRNIIAEGDPRALRDESDNPIVRQFFHRETH